MWSNRGTAMPAHSPLLIVISAPSGAGKTTLCRNLLEADPRVTRAITCTTRPPRPGEQPGLDYHFLTEEDFQARVADGKFLEHATVYGNCYGTLKGEVKGRLERGGDVLLNIDVQGAASVRREAASDPVLRGAVCSVFLTPATVQELEGRLRGRGQDAPEVIQRRLAVARQELARWEEFDYLLISDTPAEDLRRLQVIVEAEKMRRHRSELPQY